MKKTLFLLTIALACLLSACKNVGTTKVTASGTIYEVLVVIDNPQWQSQCGDSIKAYMEADMPCLPQIEPYFNISQVPHSLFDDALKATRNILYVDINPARYTQAKITYHTDVFAHPQALCKIQSPDDESFLNIYLSNAVQIRNWFVRQEIDRQGVFYRNYQTTDTREAVQKRFGCDIRIPSDYMLVRDTIYNTPDGKLTLVWCVNNGGSMRKDLLIWSYPYRNDSTFTKEFLLQKRDEVVGKNISGQIQGSFMGTEHKHFPPQFTPINLRGKYCAEIRGLWKLYGGEAMGGPFVQHTRLDEINGQVITAEVYLFAPGQKKRNPLRSAEAILYTLQLPEELMISDK